MVLLIPSPAVLIALAPFAPFKASFKDPFKTRPPTEIRAFSITILNLVPLNVYKRLLNVNIAMFVKCFLKILRLQKNFLQSMVHEGLTNMNFDTVSESSENVGTSYIVF